MKNKRGDTMQQVIIHIIIVGLMFATAFVATSQKADQRGVKQQILEKQTALLIDAAEPGMTFEIAKLHVFASVDSITLKNGRIYIGVDGLPPGEGYPYFTPHNVQVEDDESTHTITILNKP